MIPIRTLRAEAQGLTEEQFTARHPDPAFVLNLDPGAAAEPARAAGPEAWMSKTHAEGDVEDLDRTRQISRGGLADPGLTPSPEVDLDAAAARGQVVFVRKGQKSLFPGMVTIGRVPNNDIVLGYPTISKVHAYLIKKGDTWWIYDQRATNGTWVARARLASGGSQPLEDGAAINLGPSLGLTFVLPGTLYGLLRGPLPPGRRRG